MPKRGYNHGYTKEELIPVDKQKITWKLDNPESVKKAQAKQQDLISKGYRLMKFDTCVLHYHLIEAFLDEESTE